MSAPRRASEIARVLLRFKLYELLDLVQLAWYLRVLLSPLRLLRQPTDSLALRSRLALESLGPVFVKFGQLLSTRRDLLSPEFADEFALLQDAVPPFPGATAQQIIETALKAPIETLFKQFDRTALASASVAQVHAAVLPDGTDVCVKVLRPDVERVIERDLQLLHEMARFADQHSVEAQRLRLPEVVSDYEHTIRGELDFELEAANTRRLRLNFAESPLLYVPRVYSELSTTQVMTLERVFAAPMGDIEGLRRAGTDMHKLAVRGVETFFTQVFEDNFFHADMHPGNIFVDISDPKDPSWIAIDCAIMGELTSEDQSYIARSLVAFLDRDYAAVARLHVESGWVPATTDLDALTAMVRDVCEPVFEKPLVEIEFGSFLVTLFAAAREFDLKVQPQLVLLQKTLLNIEGLGRQLYPQLDLWATARPFMERWMTQQLGPEVLLERWTAHLPQLLQQLPQLPEVLLKADYEFKRLGQLTAQQAVQLEELRRDTTRPKTFARTMFGYGLLALAAALLWRPLSDALGSSEGLLTSLGLASALVGSMVLLRA